MVIEQTDKSTNTRKLNPLDAGLVVILLLGVIGFWLARSSHAGVNSAIDENGSIAIDVAFTGVKTLDVDLFKAGAPASITIRNVPVQPPMTITHVTHTPKQVSFLSPDGKKAISMPDPANPIAHDFIVTVQEDHADRTKDGWVIHGQKIKVGNTIELESAKYRVQGVIADVHKPDAKSSSLTSPTSSVSAASGAKPESSQTKAPTK